MCKAGTCMLNEEVLLISGLTRSERKRNVLYLSTTQDTILVNYDVYLFHIQVVDSTAIFTIWAFLKYNFQS